MIQNRELTMNDYMAMLRRRAKVILIPALIAPLAGFLVSYVFPAKFTSMSEILIEGQRVPENIVQPVVSEDLTARVTTLQQQILSQSRLQPALEKLYPAKNSSEISDLIDAIRTNMSIEAVATPITSIGTTKPAKPGQSPLPAFYVKYTAPSPREAQQICNELTTLLIEQNLRSVQDAASGTSDVLNRGLENAKRNLDDLDAKLAVFKKQYVGQLPGDEENNLKILTGLSSQLEANTQTLNRAQQDKAYTESMLAQQVATWRSSQLSTNPQTLEKQLSDLQSQLLQLQAKYTDDHPDVIKAKADIAEVKKKLTDINKASSDSTDVGTDKASATEPPEIRQMRLQIHQYSDLIAAATRDQGRLQKEIAQYQSRVSLSPAIEEQYKQLTRDYDVAMKGYDDLLAKKNSADLTVQMNNQSQGERFFPLFPANLPDIPSFPNRLLFLLGGLIAGMGLGAGIALWLEIQDNSIRTEADAEAALELPLLVAVPWVGAIEAKESRRFWWKGKKDDLQKDTVTI
jgi:polysaccharide chain length determinant protein (PEP-CTERM system associated)